MLLPEETAEFICKSPVKFCLSPDCTLLAATNMHEVFLLYCADETIRPPYRSTSECFDVGQIKLIGGVWGTEVCLIMEGQPDKVIQYDVKSAINLGHQIYPHAILDMKYSQTRFICILEKSFYVHDPKVFRAEPIKHHMPANPKAIFAFASLEIMPIVAYPGPVTGEVLIFNLETRKVVKTILAHKKMIRKIALTGSGNLLATSGELSCKISIFDTLIGERLYIFKCNEAQRNGDFSLSPCETYLITTTKFTSLEIFRLKKENKACCLPINLPFCQSYNPTPIIVPIHVKNVAGDSCVCGICIRENQRRLIVASAHGFYSIYEVTDDNDKWKRVCQYNFHDDAGILNIFAPDSTSSTNTILRSYSRSTSRSQIDPQSRSHSSLRSRPQSGSSSHSSSHSAAQAHIEEDGDT